MMWLLSTDRAELHYVSSPINAVGGYAILSHTWRDKEQSFQDVRAIEAQCKLDGTNPRDYVDSKIRECCKLAESHGFRWAWVDSCCIDKTSSTELSEAINSMFDWYAQSEVCYAFLEDVPSDCVVDAPESAFRRARWHTRGWTLQELIAPAVVLFMSCEWKLIGNKFDPNVAMVLHQITRIPCPVLTRRAYFFQYGIAVRISWASSRNTTRPEDEAYSLMGLLEVKIPVMYGEGRGAFQRLQEEVIKTSQDTSLFAWWKGSLVQSGTHESQGLTMEGPVSNGIAEKYLFAPSPNYFSHTADYTPSLFHPVEKYPPRQEPGDDNYDPAGPFGSIKLPKFVVTSYGVKCEFPVFEADGITVAVLLSQSHQSHLGLLLHRDGDAPDPSEPRYFTGYSFRRPVPVPLAYTFRVAELGNELARIRFNGRTYQAQWRTIYIVPRPSAYSSPSTVLFRIRHNCHPSPSFRIPRWLMSTLMRLGWDDVQEVDLDSHSKSVRFFRTTNSVGFICIDMGWCKQETQPARRWARIRVFSDYQAARFFPHDCNTDHIESWDQFTKDFGDSDRTVRLSFTPCRMNPASTLVVHLELMGSVYDAILRHANVTIPSLRELALEVAPVHKSSSLIPPVAPHSQAPILASSPESIVLDPVPTSHRVEPNFDAPRADGGAQSSGITHSSDTPKTRLFQSDDPHPNVVSATPAHPMLARAFLILLHSFYLQLLRPMGSGIWSAHGQYLSFPSLRSQMTSKVPVSYPGWTYRTHICGISQTMAYSYLAAPLLPVPLASNFLMYAVSSC